MGNNKKYFFKYINGKKQFRNNIAPFQNEGNHLTNRDKDKAKVFNAFLASVFKWMMDLSAVSWRTML